MDTSQVHSVGSVCPFCGVGCQLSYQVQHQTIVSVIGKNGPANESRLCIKGRFGWDYVSHPDRLTVPLKRKQYMAKMNPIDQAQLHWSDVFEPISWEDALEWIGQKFVQLKKNFPVQKGYKTLAALGSAKCSNEEAYLLQKLVRTGFGNNNVDHCTRLCHASSVFALLEGLGSAAVSNPIRDIEHASLVMIIGANPSQNHPVAATWMKNAAQRGTRMVIVDPMQTPLSDYAWKQLKLKPDTDVLLLNAMLHVIVKEGLYNNSFVEQRVHGFELFEQHLLS